MKLSIGPIQYFWQRQQVFDFYQQVADSADPLKRNRGRRGLDVLNKIQKSANIDIKIHEQDFPEIKEVDTKLVKMAKVLDGKVLTNDYNLNKIAELQGVTILNINELANALKPVVLPGEPMAIKLLKDGKEFNQAIGYLDDGTKSALIIILIFGLIVWFVTKEDKKDKPKSNFFKDWMEKVGEGFEKK